jgi:peroxiredoxin
MKLVLVIAAAVLALTACGGAEATDSGAGSGAGFVGGDGSIVVIDPRERVSAPDLTGQTLDGSTYALVDDRGDIVVMNVWASWCAPCRAEAPELQMVWTDVQGDGVQFVGLNTRDSNLAAQRFVETMGLTFPSVQDTDGRVQLLFSKSLPPQAIPSTLVIDRDGKVAARILGKVSATTLRGVIDEVDGSKMGAAGG